MSFHIFQRNLHLYNYNISNVTNHHQPNDWLLQSNKTLQHQHVGIDEICYWPYIKLSLHLSGQQKLYPHSDSAGLYRFLTLPPTKHGNTASTIYTRKDNKSVVIGTLLGLLESLTFVLLLSVFLTYKVSCRVRILRLQKEANIEFKFCMLRNKGIVNLQ